MAELPEQESSEGPQQPARSDVEHPEPIDPTTDEPGQNESPKEDSSDQLPDPSYSRYSWTGREADDEQNEWNEWNEEWGDWKEEEWTEDWTKEGWTGGDDASWNEGDWVHVDSETEWWYDPELSPNPKPSPNPKSSASRAESEVRGQDLGPRPQEPVMYDPDPYMRTDDEESHRSGASPAAPRSGEDVVVLRVNNITSSNVQAVTHDLMQWLRSPLERSAWRVASEQGYCMLNAQRHVWRLANPDKRYQLTRRLSEGDYIVRCRHADGTPYRPQAPVLGRSQGMRELDEEEPVQRRQRTSAYTAHAEDPAMESNELGNRDTESAAHTLLTALGILKPMLFPYAETRSERPADNSQYREDEALRREEWHGHGQASAQHSDDRHARDEASGKGDRHNGRNEAIHRGWRDRDSSPPRRCGKGSSRCHSSRTPGTPPRSSTTPGRKGGKGDRQPNRRSPSEITLNVSPGVRINVSRWYSRR